MDPEPFPHHQAVRDFARDHGLDYVFEGTAAFEECKRRLPLEQYQIMAVHSPEGIKHVLLYPRV